MSENGDSLDEQWLESLVARYGELSTVDEARRLAALWALSHRAPSKAARMSSVYECVTACAQRILAKAASGLFAAADPVLLLTAADGVYEGAIAEYRRAIIAAISEAPTPQRYHPKAIGILFCAGAINQDDVDEELRKSASYLPTIDDIFSRPASAIAATCEFIMVETRHGARPLSNQYVSPCILESLSAIMLAECRTYNIVAATAILRSLSYTGHDVPGITDAKAFIQAQHRSAGGYGFLNPFVPRDAWTQEWEDLAFRLPATTGALLAFCERR